MRSLRQENKRMKQLMLAVALSHWWRLALGALFPQNSHCADVTVEWTAKPQRSHRAGSKRPAAWVEGAILSVSAQGRRRLRELFATAEIERRVGGVEIWKCLLPRRCWTPPILRSRHTSSAPYVEGPSSTQRPGSFQKASAERSNGTRWSLPCSAGLRLWLGQSSCILVSLSPTSEAIRFCEGYPTFPTSLTSDVTPTKEPEWLSRTSLHAQTHNPRKMGYVRKCVLYNIIIVK